MIDEEFGIFVLPILYYFEKNAMKEVQLLLMMLKQILNI